MKKIITPKKIINYFAIAFAFLPMLSNSISLLLGGVFYVAIAYSLAFLTIFVNTNKTVKKDVYFACGFAFFLLFLTIYSVGTQIFLSRFRTVSLLYFDVSVTFNNFIINLPIYLSCFFVFFKSGKEDRKRFFNFYFCCLLYTIVITFVALINIPDFSKNETANIVSGQMRVFLLLGASGFGLTYSLTIILPLFFYFFGKTKRIIFLAIGVFGTIVTILSGFLISTLVLAFNFVLCLIFGIKNNIIRRLLAGLFIFACLFLLFNIEIVGKMALFAAEHIDISYVQRRLVQVANMILYNDTSGDAVSGRLFEYSKSLNSILSHPLFGNALFSNSNIESGHSTIMDPWACFGILMPILLLLFLLFFYLGATKKEKHRSAKNKVLVAFLSFLIVTLFNPIFATASICLNFILVMNCFAIVTEDEQCYSKEYYLLPSKLIYKRR